MLFKGAEMKKRILSAIITLSLCFVSIPLICAPEKVYAANITDIWDDVGTVLASATSGEYRMRGDHRTVSSSITIKAGANITLDLYGLDIKSNSTVPIFIVKGNLTLKNTDPNARPFIMRSSATAMSEPLIKVESGGTLTIKPGTGANILIKDNTADQGGGIAVYGTFNMYDKTEITNCHATYTSDASSHGNGGGVMVGKFGTFNMYGGSIHDCTAFRYGGGIENYGTFNMSGGTIKDCKTTKYDGGGIDSEGTATITGGTITGNSAKRNANQINKSSGTVSISGYCTIGGGTSGVTNSGTKTKVTFDKQSGTGGSGSVDPVTYNAAMPSATMPTRSGYTFIGYYDATSGGTKYYNSNGTSAKNWDKIVASTTLYARWSQNQTLSYVANGHGTAPSAVTMYYTSAQNAESAITGVNGYTFKEWNTKADGTGDAYAAGAVVKAANVDPVATTLYAQWSALDYTVTLHANEGVCNNLTSYKYGVGATLPIPTKTGYTFEGWYDNAQFLGNPITAISNTDTGDKEFYAKWSADPVVPGGNTDPENPGGNTDPVVPEDPVTTEPMVLLIQLSGDGAVITPKLKDGKSASSIIVNDGSAQAGPSVTLEKSTNIYKIKVVDGADEYIRQVNLNIVEYSVSFNSDTLGSAITNAENLLASTCSEEKGVYASAAAQTAFSGVISYAKTALGSNNQGSMDEAVQALALGTRSYGWSLGYDAVATDMDTAVTTVVSPQNADVTKVEYTKGVCPNLAYFDESDKITSGTGEMNLGSSGIYTFAISFKTGNTSNRILRTTIVPKYNESEASYNIEDAIRETLQEQFPGLTNQELWDMMYGGVDACLSKANQYYYQVMANNTGVNTLNANADNNGTIAITAVNAQTITVSMEKDGVKLVNTTVSLSGGQGSFTAARKGEYTVTATFRDGSKQSISIVIENDKAPITLASGGDQIGITVNSGFNIKELYYVFGDVDSSNIKDHNDMIPIKGEVSVPVLNSGKHSFYVKADFYGTTIDGIYTVDCTKSELTPVIVNTNGNVGIYHYGIDGVNAVAYIKGNDIAWSTAQTSPNLTFVPADNILIGIKGFETGNYYTFYFFKEAANPISVTQFIK